MLKFHHFLTGIFEFYVLDKVYHAILEFFYLRNPWWVIGTVESESLFGCSWFWVQGVVCPPTEVPQELPCLLNEAAGIISFAWYRDILGGVTQFDLLHIHI